MTQELITNSQDMRTQPQAATNPMPKSNVLTRIVDTKAAHIAALKLRFPEASLSPKISDR
ncbi:MAG: bifunctional indole-3-glycerol phosphate synthase/phosphoribosylanthranilate isomerase, partial [Shewanella putrefaciens]|nr:bifunctional indole-3-glycerol phosphate synthase/phosphoribosylanthranilate isomerase [Shewanella putrefaciens]